MPTRTVVASGLWSDTNTWEGGNLPQTGDDVVHPSPYVVVLDTNPPTLGGYTLNGTLLFRTNAPRTLKAASFSGSGNIDIEEPAPSIIPPITIEGTQTTPLNLTNLSSFFSYYATAFETTQHHTWWLKNDVDYFDEETLRSPFFPRIESVARSGGDLILTVSTLPNSPAAHYLSTYTNASKPFLISLRHPTFQTQALTLSEPTNLTIVSATTLRYPSAPSGLENEIVVGGHIIIVEHTSLCPLVLKKVSLPATKIVGAVISADSQAPAAGVTFSRCFLLSALSTQILKGDIFAFLGSINESVILDAEKLIWCAYKPSSS